MKTFTERISRHLKEFAMNESSTDGTRCKPQKRMFIMSSLDRGSYQDRMDFAGLFEGML